MMEMMEKLKTNSKKDKLKDLIKMLNSKILESDGEEEESPKMKVTKVEMSSKEEDEQRLPSINEESEDDLLKDMEKHEEKEIEEDSDEEKTDEDSKMLSEIKSFMKMHRETPEYMKNKKTKTMMMDPTVVPQSSQSKFKTSTDDFDVKMSKKKKFKMRG